MCACIASDFRLKILCVDFFCTGANSEEKAGRSLVLELRFESKIFLSETRVLTSRLECCMLFCAMCVIVRVFTCIDLHCIILSCLAL